MLNLIIKFQPLGDGYKVELLNGAELLESGSTSQREVTEGFADLKFNDSPIHLARVLELWKQPTQSVDEQTHIGMFLARILTHRLLDKLLDLQAEAEDNNSWVCTRLEIASSELRNLPWELLNHRGKPLFKKSRHPIAFRNPGLKPIEASCDWPLRMLVMVGNSDNQLNCQKELWAIRRAMGRFALRVDIRIVYPDSAETATELFAEFLPHIFHFLGHADTDGDGSLDLLRPVDSMAGSESLTRDDVFSMLDSIDPIDRPRLVVLNACNTVGRDGVESNNSACVAFLEARCNAVIATRRKFGDVAAIKFASTFYSELAAKGLDRVDSAYCRAINGVSLLRDDVRDWSTPRLYLQCPAESVFKLTGSMRPTADEGSQYADLQRLYLFVDRDVERFKTYHQTNGWLRKPNSPLLVIHGTGETGKSWLLQALVYAAKLRNRPAIYADMRAFPRDLEDILELVLTGATASNNYLTQSLAKQPDSILREYKRQCDIASCSAADEDPKKSLITAFRNSLRELEPSSPVLIALDHVQELDANACWKYLRDELISPYVEQNDVSHVTFALAVNDEHVEKLGLSGLQRNMGQSVIPIPDDLQDSYDELMTTWFLREMTSDDEDEEFATLLKNLPARLKKRFGLKSLRMKWDGIKTVWM